jgi:hypothetical protein
MSTTRVWFDTPPILEVHGLCLRAPQPTIDVMRTIIVGLALIVAPSALHGQRSRIYVAPTTPGLIVPDSSVLAPVGKLSRIPTQIRVRVDSSRAAPVRVCPMPVVVPDSSRLEQMPTYRPDTSWFARIPPVGSGCVNPLFRR